MGGGGLGQVGGWGLKRAAGALVVLQISWWRGHSIEASPLSMCRARQLCRGSLLA